MQIESINNAIAELETAETTVKNVQELACLYIIRDKLQNANKHANSTSDSVFLPYYNVYIEDKRKFQRREVSADIIKEDIQNVCVEIIDFLNMLYSCTDSEYEREVVKNMFERIHEKFCGKI